MSTFMQQQPSELKLIPPTQHVQYSMQCVNVPGLVYMILYINQPL